MKNYYISYLKWLAIIFIILVHLINWSDMYITTALWNIKDFFHVGTLYFVVLSWSLIVIAYGKYDNIWKANKKLLKRALMLFGIYMLYSIIKITIFDFSKEPFFDSFAQAWKLNLISILTFKSYVVPITILLLWCMFLAVTPLILYINKYCKYKKYVILGLISILAFINYFLVFPKNTLTNILYWEDFIFYWFNLWLLPYLIWIYLWMIWFEKIRLYWLIFFWVMTTAFFWYQISNWMPVLLDDYMFPIKPYFITACFFVMFLFIYIIIWLKKIWNKAINYALSILKLLWDKTLFIYITHWIIIDITIWIARPNHIIIWLTVPLYIVLYIYLHKEKILKHKFDLDFWDI